MASYNPSLSVVLDDTTSDELTFGGPASWTSSNSAQWFNGTAHTPTFALNNSGTLATMTLEFTGTSAAFIGVTPPHFPDSQIFTVTIDDSAPYNTTYGDPNPPSYRQWFQTPTLADGKHRVSLTRIAGATFDYAVLGAGAGTQLLEQRVLVDNDDNSGVLAYTTGWKRSSDQFNSGPGTDGFPHQNTTHQASSIGDSMALRFTGKAVAVYGVFSWSNIGSLSLNFSLDGSSMIRKYQVKDDTPQFVTELGQQPHFQFHSYDLLNPGDHNLTVTIVECLNQTFMFDYLLYQPTFASIDDMPKLQVQSPTYSTGTSTPTNGRMPVRIIIGACVGTAIFTLLFVAIVYRFRRRSKKPGAVPITRGIYAPIDPFVHSTRSGASGPIATSRLSLTGSPFGQYQSEPIDLQVARRYSEDDISSNNPRYPPYSSPHYTQTYESGYSGDMSHAPPPSYEAVANDSERRRSRHFESASTYRPG